MGKTVAYNKMSKKAKKAYNDQRRSVNGFNTGTRIHQDAKHPNRQKQKNNLKKALDF